MNQQVDFMTLSSWLRETNFICLYSLKIMRLYKNLRQKNNSNYEKIIFNLSHFDGKFYVCSK